MFNGSETRETAVTSYGGPLGLKKLPKNLKKIERRKIPVANPLRHTEPTEICHLMPPRVEFSQRFSDFFPRNPNELVRRISNN